VRSPDRAACSQTSEPRAPAPDSQKRGIRLLRIKRKLFSHDPQRLAILSRLLAIVRRLPPNGRLLFFDIQPIAVNAYGGCRFSSAKRLILERRQRARGFFYLFLCYDLRSGRVHWAFLLGKSAKYVCQFMRRIRRWYPDQEIWIALDQDRAHPRKCGETRRTMRELKLRWISLPKGSPDDNPVETVFSDIQASILECGNDPDAKATQRRISAHLRNRNRRTDRHIQISYLPDTHKE